jgi:hypothetical protein
MKPELAEVLSEALKLRPRVTPAARLELWRATRAAAERVARCMLRGIAGMDQRETGTRR